MSNCNGCTPLQANASKGYLYVVLELLARGASPNSVGEGEQIALCVAAAAGSVHVVQTMLSLAAKAIVESALA